MKAYSLILINLIALSVHASTCSLTFASISGANDRPSINFYDNDHIETFYVTELEDCIQRAEDYLGQDRRFQAKVFGKVIREEIRPISLINYEFSSAKVKSEGKIMSADIKL